MFGRSLLAINLANKSLTSSVRRQIHKGVDSTPPMRYISNSKKIALYLFIVGSFLSYPSYVLSNMDNLRKKPDNELEPSVVEQLEARKAARKDGTFKPFQ
ncbi:Hypothetical protein SRAE_X000029100 [Strongyloides ratti]|uniref:Uncharacterized protein n=1 Tax=Strongyloides ratti TaxID=34506 RepID=A0A090N0M8_STRRB|nr:Hypothetical protein SRAE_X000029100 [Strongyloides ratti]CEF70963.1 Hypothetical protein SRAE_X000029100 [Strongyloides ratti]